jgi:hypothetical protein
MREIRTSGSEGGARFNPLSLPLSFVVAAAVQAARDRFSDSIGGSHSSASWTLAATFAVAAAVQAARDRFSDSIGGSHSSAS